MLIVFRNMTYSCLKCLISVLIICNIVAGKPIKECCKVIEIYNENDHSEQQNVAGFYELQPKMIQVRLNDYSLHKSNWYVYEENGKKRVLYSDGSGWVLSEIENNVPKNLIRMDNADKCLRKTNSPLGSLTTEWHNYNDQARSLRKLWRNAGKRDLKIRCDALEGVWGLNQKDHTYTMVDDYNALYNYQPDTPQQKHPCDRECIKDEHMICKYRFDISIYSTITKNLDGKLVGQPKDIVRACGDCPNTVADCFKPLCISADGAARSVVSINRQMPGPPIAVCKNDTIIVDVHNKMDNEATIIHFHGEHFRGQQYMDGVPFITQCPINPNTQYTYTFKAKTVGTMFYHSHVSFQRGDGNFGAYIVRLPDEDEPNKDQFDFDLTEHVIFPQEWHQESTRDMWAKFYFNLNPQKPKSILLNGRGRRFNRPAQNRIDVTLLGEAKVAQSSTEGIYELQPNKINDKQHWLHQDGSCALWYNKQNQNWNIGQIGNLGSTSALIKSSDVSIGPLEATTWSYENSGQFMEATSTNLISLKAMETEFDVWLEKDAMETPLNVFKVTKGSKYRFRVISPGIDWCPIEVSVEGHTLTLITTDVDSIEPKKVTSFIMSNSERYDFVIDANQESNKYEIRFGGYWDCSNVTGLGYLVYDDYDEEELYDIAAAKDLMIDVSKFTNVKGISEEFPQVGTINLKTGQSDTSRVNIQDLKHKPSQEIQQSYKERGLKENPDKTFIMGINFNKITNPHYHDANFFSYSNLLDTPQFNNISFKSPSKPLLSQGHDIGWGFDDGSGSNEARFCNNDTAFFNDKCVGKFCECIHVLVVDEGDLVELVIYDEGKGSAAAHPFHLHGQSFYVVAKGSPRSDGPPDPSKGLGDGTKESYLDRFEMENMNVNGSIIKNLDNPPLKDVVTIPDAGYSILRFKADNVGYWIAHCHMSIHAHGGMMFVVKVGDVHREQEINTGVDVHPDALHPIPKGFPTCENFGKETPIRL